MKTQRETPHSNDKLERGHSSDSSIHSVTDDELKYEANLIEQEARMILPGIQTLFGFQLVTVFNGHFIEGLTHNQQVWHVMAMGLAIFSMGLAIAPAAYNRERATKTVSKRFVILSNRLLRWTLMPLAMAVAIDFGLIGVIVFENINTAVTLASLVFIFLNLLWYGFPGIGRSHQQSQFGTPQQSSAPNR